MIYTQSGIVICACVKGINNIKVRKKNKEANWKTTSKIFLHQICSLQHAFLHQFLPACLSSPYAWACNSEGQITNILCYNIRCFDSLGFAVSTHRKHLHLKCF